MPAPPPYGSSSTWPGAERRRVAVVEEAQLELGAEHGRERALLGSQAKACGTRVKTSSCKGGRRGYRRREAGRDHDRPASRSTSRTQSSTSGRQQAAVEHEHVVRDARLDVLRRGRARGRPPRSTLEADELEDVVLVLVRRRQRRARHLERSAPRCDRAVEPDHRPAAAAALRRDDDLGLAPPT